MLFRKDSEHIPRLVDETKTLSAAEMPDNGDQLKREVNKMTIELVIGAIVLAVLLAVIWQRFVTPFMRQIMYDIVNHLHED